MDILKRKQSAGLLFAGFIPFLALSVVYILNGFFPYGKGSVVALDLNSQYMPLLYRFYDVVMGSKNPFIDFHIAGGTNLFSDTVTELINPFNYILLLFGRNNLYLGVNVLLIIYSVTASVVAYRVLSRFNPQSVHINVILSTVYSLSFYSAYQYEIIRWMFLVVLFPLYFYSIKRMIEEKKILSYTLLLSYILMLSLQIGIQLLLFTFVFSIFYLGKEFHDIKSNSAVMLPALGRTCVRIGLSTMAGILLSGVITLPTVANIFASSRSDQNTSLISVITRHGLDDLAERLLEITNPILIGMVIAIVILYRFSLKEIYKENRHLILALVAMIATVILQPSNLLWHLGYYQCFSVRYGFSVVFLTVVLVQKILTARYKSVGIIPFENRLMDIAASGISVLLMIIPLFYTFTHRLMFAQAFATLAISRLCHREIFLVYLIMFALTLSTVILSIFFYKKSNRKGYSYFGMLLSFMTGVILYMMILLPKDSGARIFNEKAYEDMNLSYNESIDYSSRGRVRDRDDLPLNAPLVNNEYSMTAYVPQGEDKAYLNGMTSLGYVTPWITVRSTGGTILSDALLGIGGGFNNGVLLSFDAFAVLKNGYSDMPLYNQKLIAKALGYDIGMDADDVMDIIRPIELGRNSKDNDIRLSIKGRKHVYITLNTVQATIFVNDEAVVYPSTEYSQNPEGIYDLGEYEDTVIYVKPVDENNIDIERSNIVIGLIDIDAFEDFKNRVIENNSFVMSLNDRSGEVTVEFDEEKEGVLLLPLANIKGLDCEEDYLADYFGGFTSIHMTKPVKTLTVTYKLPLLPIGFLLSIIGVILLWFAVYIKDLNIVALRIAHVIYTLLVIVFLLGVYILPNVGMIGYMGGKVFGVDLLGQQAKTLDEETIMLSSETEADGIHVVLATENLIVEKRAVMTADSYENKSFKPKNAGDGNYTDKDSRWSSVNDRENNDHFLQADLRDPEMISAVRINWDRLNACKYSVDTSMDGENWNTEKSFSKTPATRSQVIVFDTPKEARFIRLRVYEVTKDEDDGSLYYQNVSVSELEVYGSDCDSFTISPVRISTGEERELPLPAVPYGYTIKAGGIDYANLLLSDGHLADTISDVEANIGYVLEKNGSKWELPGFTLTIPSSDPNYKEEVFPYTSFDVPEKRMSQDTIPINSDTAFYIEENELIEDFKDLREVASEELAFAKARTRKNYIQSGKDILLRFVLNEDTEELGKEGYEIEVKDNRQVTITASSYSGFVWGTVTLKKMLTENPKGIYLGKLRDYPKYDVRGFNIDVGRRPVSIGMLYDLIDLMSEHKMNTLQVHLNDNVIISTAEYDNTVDGARKLYSGFRLESNIENKEGKGLTSEDYSYSKEEFRDLIAYAKKKGVSLVPEIDTPAHSMRLVSLFTNIGFDSHPELADTIDISKPEAVNLVMTLWKEYLVDEDDKAAVFADCDTIHLGLDEYFGPDAPYQAYCVNLVNNIKQVTPDKDIRIWGSLSYKNVNPDLIPKDVQMMIWSMIWADPQAMYDEGFGIINCLSRDLYIIPGGGQDRLDVDHLKNDWEPNIFKDEELLVVIPEWSPNMLGACYSLWNDNYDKSPTVTEDELMVRIKEPISTLSGKLW